MHMAQALPACGHPAAQAGTCNCLSHGGAKGLQLSRTACHTGTSSPKRAVENLQAAKIKLSQQDLADLEAAVVALPPAAH